MPGDGGKRFGASVVVRTPEFGVRDSRILYGASCGMPRRGSVPNLGSMAAQMALEGGVGYAEVEPNRDDGRAEDFAMVTRPTMWSGRVAKVAAVVVPYRDRSVLSSLHLSPNWLPQNGVNKRVAHIRAPNPRTNSYIYGACPGPRGRATALGCLSGVQVSAPLLHQLAALGQ